jgi:hypothetical protein
MCVVPQSSDLRYISTSVASYLSQPKQQWGWVCGIRWEAAQDTQVSGTGQVMLVQQLIVEHMPMPAASPVSQQVMLQPRPEMQGLSKTRHTSTAGCKHRL